MTFWHIDRYGTIIVANFRYKNTKKRNQWMQIFRKE